MKHKSIMLCAAFTAAILTGCESTGGPSLKLEFGYKGAEVGISWTPSPKPDPTLEEAGNAINSLSGKAPVPAAP